MKIQKFVSILILTVLFFSATCQAGNREFYQIKIYSIENEQQEMRMDKFLKDAYLPAMHRAGIEDVGVFKPIENEKMQGKLIYVFIPFKSIDEFEKLNGVLHQDKKFQKEGGDYINSAHLRLDNLFILHGNRKLVSQSIALRSSETNSSTCFTCGRRDRAFSYSTN